MRNKHLWLFNCANTFSGNPKWLFLYVAEHRKDITPVWVSDSKETTRLIRKLGYHAVEFDSKRGQRLQQEAGVFVVNQVKEVIPDLMTGITLLNLWHGVGVKKIERAMTEGDLLKRISKKYVQNNRAYRESQLFLVPSQLMEEHFAEQIEYSPDQVIRGGYPQNSYPKQFQFTPTFDHDIRARAGAPSDARLAVYAPTYRLDRQASFLRDVIPDFARLTDALESSNTLLILKMHPSMEKDSAFLHLREIHKDSPWLHFWEGDEDLYEILSAIDLAIVDYSSILYDFIAAGIESFVRYIPDYAEESGVHEHALDYMTHSCGTVVTSFEELLAAFQERNTVAPSELEALNQQFWGYSDENDLASIVDAGLAYSRKNLDLPDLYSFDVFDTLIHRSTVTPESVFYLVEHQIRASEVSFPADLAADYVQARRASESAARENRRKRPDLVRTGDLEIQFSDIFAAMQVAYSLSDAQVALLMEWEVQGELRVVVPDAENIKYLRTLVDRGETVVLISDMYLPVDVIKQLLIKADPLLGELPLYLSTVERAQKSTGWLYVKVYLDQNYTYGRWLHIGDNARADGVAAKRQGLIPELLETPSFSGFELEVLNASPSFDMHHVASLLREYRVGESEGNDVDDFVFQNVALYLVPYVCWTIEDALSRGYKTLYFVSRDGHHLKLIADAIIRAKGLSLRTKYIYGSRTSWRLASQFGGIDAETFSPFGSFGGVRSYNALLKAAHLTSEEFLGMFPAYEDFKDASYIDGYSMGEIIMALNTSTIYREHLANVAQEAFALTSEYLLAEVNLNEPFGIVEYWGRGYTQDCLVEILEEATGVERDIPFYYARSIYPSEGRSVRHNFTVKNYSLLVIEAIFANMPHGTVEGFERRGGKVHPVVEPRAYDEDLFDAMERLLPRFARRYAQLDFVDANASHRSAFNAAFRHFARNPDDPVYRNRIAHLRDAVELGGREREFAPLLSVRDFVRYMRGRPIRELTSSLRMSTSRKLTFGARLFKLQRELGLRRRLKPKMAKIAAIFGRTPTKQKFTPEISTRLHDFIAERE